MQEEYSKNINGLLFKFLNGKADHDEIHRLESWLKQSRQHQEYYARVKNIYEMSGYPDPGQIHTGMALKKVLRRINPQHRKLGIIVQRIAAILFLPLLAASLYFYFQNKTISALPVHICEIQAAAGLRSSITLSDGTTVWLNSGSKMCYPDRFDQSERVVSIEGEAYFEVSANPERPFIVQTRSIQVLATGTSFNIVDFEHNPDKEVALISGKVSVARRSDGKLTPIAELKPGQHISYDTITRSASLFEGDLYKFYAWKDNRIVFRNDPMTEVVKRISQQYGIRVELRGEELKDYRYRATFEEESLYDILKLLKLSAPIDYEETRREQQADGSFSASKIVIFPIKNNH